MIDQDQKNALVGRLAVELARINPSQETALAALKEAEEHVRDRYAVTLEIGAAAAKEMRRVG